MCHLPFVPKLIRADETAYFAIDRAGVYARGVLEKCYHFTLRMALLTHIIPFPKGVFQKVWS